MTNINKPLFYPENIPDELKKRKQWVLYHLKCDPNREKPTKIPCTTDNAPASATNPATWCNFKEALKTFRSGIGDGLGFVFTDKDPYCGIDLDSSCDLLGPDKWAEQIIKRFSSYTEYSPSGTGLHIIIKGKKQITNCRKDKIEIYDDKRFFTFTGNVYDHLFIINEGQDELDAFCKEIFSAPEIALSHISSPAGKELSESEINALIAQMRSTQNGQKFTLLFEGNWQGKYRSQSEADQALCNILAFYTNNNHIAIDQFFRKSGLYREKWERRKDYREGTIANAINFHHNQALSTFTPSESITVVDMIPIIHINNVEYKETEFQIDKIWPTNSVGFISGQPGSCKTWFAWALAESIASGTKFLDTYPCKKGKVIAFNAEDNPSLDTRRRINALAKQKGLTLTDLNFYLLDTYSLLLNEEITKQRIIKTIQNERPNFIIFDPLRNVHTLNEDNATDMTPLLNFLREINRRFNCSVLLVCHDKKPSNQNSGNRAAQVRGSSAIVGWRDNALYLDRDKNGLIQVEIYNRGFKSISPFYADLVVENDKENNPITAYFKITSRQHKEVEKETEICSKLKTIIAEQGPISRNNLCKNVQLKRETTLNAVKTLLALGEIKDSEDGLIINNIFED